MAYCIVDDIKQAITEQELINLTDETSSGQIVTAIVQAAIDSTASLIDGYLRGEYEVPYTGEDTPILKQINVDLTVYELYTRRNYQATSEAIMTRYNNAIKRLKDLEAGTVRLRTQVTTIIGTVHIEGPDREYTEELYSRMP